MKAWLGLALCSALACTGCGDDSDEGGAGQGGSGGMSANAGMNAGAGRGMAGGGSGTGGSSNATGDGQVTADWRGYCTLTFTEDYDVVDSFGDIELSVKAGSTYLAGDAGPFGDAVLLYLTDAGPVEFEIELDDPAMPPYTSYCDENASPFIAVFVDTTVYLDEAMTMQACTLAAGTTAPGGSFGYALVGDLFTSATYEVNLGNLAAQCSGTEIGYLEAARETIGSTTYTVIPFATVTRQ
jgi:hypothetical protein